MKAKDRRSAVDLLETVTRVMNQVLVLVAGLVLATMVLLTCANIFLRSVWVPIQGTFELMGYFGAVCTAFALGYTQMRQGHISVDILVRGFPAWLQRVVHGINGIICMAFFAVVAWHVSKYATTLLRTGEVTETLRIVYYPFIYGVALGCACLAVVFLTELVKAAGHKEARK